MLSCIHLHSFAVVQMGKGREEAYHQVSKGERRWTKTCETETDLQMRCVWTGVYRSQTERISESSHENAHGRQTLQVRHLFKGILFLQI